MSKTIQVLDPGGPVTLKGTVLCPNTHTLVFVARHAKTAQTIILVTWYSRNTSFTRTTKTLRDILGTIWKASNGWTALHAWKVGTAIAIVIHASVTKLDTTNFA